MAKNEIEKVLNIKVNYVNAIKKIAEYRAKLDKVKKAEEELKKQLKEDVFWKKCLKMPLLPKKHGRITA